MESELSFASFVKLKINVCKELSSVHMLLFLLCTDIPSSFIYQWTFFISLYLQRCLHLFHKLLLALFHISYILKMVSQLKVHLQFIWCTPFYPIDSDEAICFLIFLTDSQFGYAGRAKMRTLFGRRYFLKLIKSGIWHILIIKI